VINAPTSPRETQTDGKVQTRSVSVIIPAFNEGDTIADTIQNVQAMAKEESLEAEIVVIDDGSADETGLKASDQGARTLRHPHNVGYGRSLKDGIAAASHDTIVITDADGTYPIDTIPRLLAEYAKGFDMVVGARTGDVYHGPLLKRALRWVLRFLVEFTAGRRIPDINSGLRVFSRDAIMTYFPHLCDGFSFTTSMTLGYMMTGKFVTYMNVPYHERVGKTKVKLFRDSLRTMQFIVEAIVYYNPIKIFILISLMSGIAGIICLAVGFGFGVVGLDILGGVFVLAVVLVFCLGLLAVLLKQIMDRTQARRDGVWAAPR
jgi:polyisoprenyl-phosphate glycosyltransferase